MCFSTRKNIRKSQGEEWRLLTTLQELPIAFILLPLLVGMWEAFVVVVLVTVLIIEFQKKLVVKSSGRWKCFLLC